MARVVFITIESIGNSSGLIRFASGPVAFDSSSLYVECLELYPSEIGAEVDLKTGQSSVGGQSFSLARAGASPYLYDVRGPQTLGTLTAALTSTAISMSTDVTDGSLASTLIIYDREVIAVGSHSGSGAYAITRGQLGTPAMPHASGSTVVDATTYPILRDRRVTLGVVDSGATSYSAEETLWVGHLREISAPTPERIAVEADTTLGILSDLKIGQALWRGTRSGVNPEFTGYGTPYASSGDLIVSIDGKSAMGPLTYTAGDDTTIVSLVNAETLRGCPIVTDWQETPRVWEIIEPGAILTSGEVVSTNRIEWLLQLLTTTEDGTNGDYDLGIGDLGCGLPAELIDVDGFEAFRDLLGDDAEESRWFLFVEDKPVEVIEEIERILRPYQAALTIDASGRITVAYFQDAGEATTSLTSANICAPPHFPAPSQYRRLAQPIDVLEVTWDQRPGLPPRRDTFDDVLALRRTLAGRKGGDALDLTWVQSEPKARRVAVYSLQRWRVPIPLIDLVVPRTVAVGTGDLVSVTYGKIYRAFGGTLGVTSAVMQVVAEKLDLGSATRKLRLLYTGAIYTRSGLIAPSALVASYNAGLLEITVQANAFQTGNLAAYPKDVSGFQAGDLIDLCDRDHSVLDTFTILSTTPASNAIYIDAIPSVAPTAGKLIKMSDQTSQPTTNTDLWVYLDGGAVDPSYQWTT